MIVYWLSQLGVSFFSRDYVQSSSFANSSRQHGAGPLILSWINEICSDDTEKRALLVAMGNDFAYVVQAVVSLPLPPQK